MAKVREEFIIGGENSVVNFNYFDIAEGSVIVEFFGARVSVDATQNNDEFILTTKTNLGRQSNSALLTTPIDSTTDIDFDVKFKKPKIIEGIVTVLIPTHHTGSAGTYATTITIRKFSGATESDLATLTLPTFSPAGAEFSQLIGKVNVPREHFKKNDILRMTMTGTKTGGGVFDVLLSVTGEDTNLEQGGKMIYFVPFDKDVTA